MSSSICFLSPHTRRCASIALISARFLLVRYVIENGLRRGSLWQPRVEIVQGCNTLACADQPSSYFWRDANADDPWKGPFFTGFEAGLDALHFLGGFDARLLRRWVKNAELVKVFHWVERYSNLPIDCNLNRLDVEGSLDWFHSQSFYELQIVHVPSLNFAPDSTCSTHHFAVGAKSFQGNESIRFGCFTTFAEAQLYLATLVIRADLGQRGTTNMAT